jgi:hypothetical protein
LAIESFQSDEIAKLNLKAVGAGAELVRRAL